MSPVRKKVLIGVVVVLIGAAVVFANVRYSRSGGKQVNVETIAARDLQAIVSASGKIQPKRSVNISADTMGRVTELAISEGETVRRGQFLLQIDPTNLQSAVARTEASLGAATAQLEQMRTAVLTARENLALAQETLRRQRELWREQLTPKEALDRAETEVKLREAELREREQQIQTQEQRIRQERASLNSVRYDLTKVRITSPIEGIVTRRNIEAGETVVIGTMNNPGTVLLTIADMSVIEAEIEVDETDIPSVRIGQVAKVTVDALPNRTFSGHVTEIGNSPILATGQAQAGQQATNFKVKVTVDEEIPDVRPGFTCTAEITTDTREQALAVPIQAMAVRQVVFDEKGEIVREPPDKQKRGRRSAEPVVSAETLPAGQERRETEGVFVARDDAAVFVPVKTGIAGDRYFEVLSGLEAGDRVITGPFASVRELADGDRVKVQALPSTARR
jgi:HlyD family secretion protein